MPKTKAESNFFGIPFGELHPVGLSLPDNLGYEQWLEIGLALGRIDNIKMWAIGDWWARAEAYGDRVGSVMKFSSANLQSRATV